MCVLLRHQQCVHVCQSRLSGNLWPLGTICVIIYAYIHDFKSFQQHLIVCCEWSRCRCTRVHDRCSLGGWRSMQMDETAPSVALVLYWLYCKAVNIMHAATHPLTKTCFKFCFFPLQCLQTWEDRASRQQLPGYEKLLPVIQEVRSECSCQVLIMNQYVITEQHYTTMSVIRMTAPDLLNHHSGFLPATVGSCIVKHHYNVEKINDSLLNIIRLCETSKCMNKPSV